jgi:hypothetical protein
VLIFSVIVMSSSIGMALLFSIGGPNNTFNTQSV